MSNNSSIHFVPLESKVCPRCNGSTHEPDDVEKVCQLCFGTGIASARTQSVVIPPRQAVADMPTTRMDGVHLSSTSVVRIAHALREAMRNPTGTWPSIKAAMVEQPSLRRTVFLSVGTMFVLFGASLVSIFLLPGWPFGKSTAPTAVATSTPTSTLALVGATATTTATTTVTLTPQPTATPQPTTPPQPTATPQPTETSVPTATPIVPTATPAPPTPTPVTLPLTVSPSSIIFAKSVCLSSAPPSATVNLYYNDNANGPTLYWSATSNANYSLNGGSTTTGALNTSDAPEPLTVASIKKSGVVTIAPSDGVSFPKQTVVITCQ